jgi:hypothetical protein
MVSNSVYASGTLVMDMCNEAEGQSAAKLNDTTTPTTAAAAATAIEPAAAPSKTSQLIEMPASELALGASLIESEKTAGSKTDGLETPLSKPAVEPALPNINEVSETEPPKVSSPMLDPAKPSQGKPAVPKPDWIKPLPPGEPLAAKGTDSTDRSMLRSGRFAMLAASLAVAAGLGAVAGALGASAVALTAATPVPGPVVSSTDVDETQSLKATVAQLRADVSALRVTIETANKAANGQLTKIAERFDRIERAQAEPVARNGKAVEALERLERRADTGASRETTGSLLTGPAAAPATAPPTVPGWAVRDVYRGVALIQGPRRGLIEVEAGDVIPGIGRVESIRKQDGHWIVTTSRGIIASR